MLEERRKDLLWLDVNEKLAAMDAEHRAIRNRIRRDVRLCLSLIGIHYSLLVLADIAVV
jgi:hypothetical protein